MRRTGHRYVAGCGLRVFRVLDLVSRVADLLLNHSWIVQFCEPFVLANGAEEVLNSVWPRLVYASLCFAVFG